MGALAALLSAAIWAYASTRYALGSRTLGSARVNLARATVVLPPFFVASALSTRGHLLDGISTTRAAWLFVSVICAYAFADNLFFAAARKVGVTTALAIASLYPLWAAVVGVLFHGERFGALRAGGALLCVGGAVALIVLAPRAADEQPHQRSSAREARAGIALAVLTSILWAGNTVASKLGGTGLAAWHTNLVRFAFAWPILAVTSAFVPRPTTDEAGARAAYRALVPVSLLEAGLGASLFVYGLAHTDLAVGATLSSLAPLMSVPFALLYQEERWSLPRFCAVVATVAGVMLLVAS